jgi:hypothetical protein
LRWLSILGLSACFSPSPPTGAPCIQDLDCPGSQVCHTVTRTCEASCAGCTDAAAGDGPVADGPPGADCWESWLSGNVAFSGVTRHDELQSAGLASQNPSLANDGLAIYFDRNQDFFRATRSSLTDPFGLPALVTELRTDSNESKISTTADDAVAVFASARNGSFGLLDLWQAERGGPGGSFGAPSNILFIGINDANNQFDPEITPDGRHLYYSPNENGAQTIRRASRDSLNDPFTNITTVMSDATMLVFDPAISPDQRVLVFARRSGMEPPDLVFATRDSTTIPFGPVTPLEELNTLSSDGDPDLSPDGCTMVFASNREAGGSAIYSVAIKR